MSAVRCLRNFARARRGLAAIEFAMLAPMMIFLLFGSMELLDMVQANRRVQNTAASLADVVSRDTAISNAELTGLWSALDLLMFPSSGADMQVRVTSVSITSANSATVVWSEVNGTLTRHRAGDPVDLDDDMMVAGTSVIWTETFFTYRPILGFLLPGNATLHHEAFRRSRLVDPIPRTS